MRILTSKEEQAIDQLIEEVDKTLDSFTKRIKDLNTQADRLKKDQETAETFIRFLCEELEKCGYTREDIAKLYQAASFDFPKPYINKRKEVKGNR